MSYDIGANANYFSGGWRSTSRALITPKGVFPTGLLPIVKKYLQDEDLPYNLKDQRVKPKSIENLYYLDPPFPPYDEQVEAALAAVTKERAIIAAPTGLGKSLIIALVIFALQVSTLVVVPSLELKRQLTETLTKWFGEDRVGQGKPILVENVDALNPKKLELRHAVIVDELHHVAASTYRKLNQKSWKNVYYRIGLTATPFRSQESERLLFESFLSEVGYTITYKTAVDKGYIVPLKACYYNVITTQETGNTWPEVYSKLVVNNDVRNTLIANTLLIQKDKYTLCLVKEIKHGKILSEMTGIPFANGQDEGSRELIRAFSEGSIKALIGTTGVLGEGVDTRPAEVVVIAGLGKSKNAFMQQCGRAFRRHGDKKAATVILFNDSSHKWTKAHFKAQVKYLKEEYGTDIICVDT